MKINHRKSNFYTQGQRFAARALFIVGLLVSGSSGSVLAAQGLFQKAVAGLALVAGFRGVNSQIYGGLYGGDAPGIAPLPYSAFGPDSAFEPYSVFGPDSGSDSAKVCLGPWAKELEALKQMMYAASEYDSEPCRRLLETMGGIDEDGQGFILNFNAQEPIIAPIGPKGQQALLGITAGCTKATQILAFTIFGGGGSLDLTKVGLDNLKHLQEFNILYGTTEIYGLEEMVAAGVSVTIQGSLLCCDPKQSLGEISEQVPCRPDPKICAMYGVPLAPASDYSGYSG